MIKARLQALVGVGGGHLDVDDCDIGLVCAHLAQQVVEVAGLADDFEALHLGAAGRLRREGEANLQRELRALLKQARACRGATQPRARTLRANCLTVGVRTASALRSPRTHKVRLTARRV